MSTYSAGVRTLLSLTLLAVGGLARANEAPENPVEDLAPIIRAMADRNPQQGVLTGSFGARLGLRASSHEAAYVAEQLIYNSDWSHLGKAERTRLASGIRAVTEHIDRNVLTEFTPVERGMAEGAIGVHIRLPGFATGASGAPMLTLIRHVGGPSAGAVEVRVPTASGTDITHLVPGPHVVHNPFISGGTYTREHYRGRPTMAPRGKSK